MFNSFPQPKPDSGGGPWLHDWTAYQTVYDLTGTTVSVPMNNWQTFVNVTGKGFLKWVRAFNITASGQYNPSIRITIDGVPYLFQQGNGAITQGNEINQEIPFRQSLIVEVFNSSAGTQSYGCDYLYLLAQSTPNPNKTTLLQQSQRNMGFLNTTNTTLTDVINVTGSGYLLGIRFLGFYATAGWDIFGDIAIDGSQKMTDRLVFSPYAAQTKQTEVVGPIRFNSSLKVRTRSNGTGSQPVCFVWYSLD